MEIIARIRSDFNGKFGIPRQSGLVDALSAEIVFEPEYCVEEAFRGLKEYSHIWVIWGFHENAGREWSPTVRPPRLGGNTRIGVFATRSPYRPNPIGLSCVRLLEIRHGTEGTVLRISGGDMLNGTPVYDIKPYLPYVDIRPDATGGFTDRTVKRTVAVEIPAFLRNRMPADKIDALEGILREDPRPAYQDDPNREYAFEFGGKRIRFHVENGVLKVTEIVDKDRHDMIE
ncbi:MAG: tRNA (N6-threonylcarbamoyladenosine(37)-N6)-methyltransferase TrmO [Clostridia bacterium]|nr:tRNA (N6-threonylcarbamoyladenosine(37)-N6)-methyltransferase TrmO [Clostridia bacterium]